MGSVNGMPSSITSAPAARSAERIASEVAGSGSPAVRNVTSAARPARASSAKRWSMRVLMRSAACCARHSLWQVSLWQILALARPHRGHADVDGAEHEDAEREDELHPLLLFDERSRSEQARAQDIENVGGGDEDQEPAHELLTADHCRVRLLRARYWATLARSLSPRAERLTTIR